MRIIIVALIVMGGNIMNRRKWDKIRTSKCFIGTVLIGLMLCACGSNDDGKVVEKSEEVSTVAEEQLETNIEVTDQNTENPIEDTETGKKDGETDEKSETTEMIDWETFAAQEDNEDICVVVSNEIRGHQELIMPADKGEAAYYEPCEGDRFAVPIKENILWISLVTINNLEIINNERLFLKDQLGQDLTYIEISFPKGNNYNLFIQKEEDKDAMQFFIQNE